MENFTRILRSKLSRRAGWALSFILVFPGCGRIEEAWNRIEESQELAKAEPPPALREEIPVVTDVSDAPLKIILDKIEVPAQGTLTGVIRGRLPGTGAFRIVWLDEWNRAVAHAEWAPSPKTPKEPGKFSLDLSTGLAPKGRKQRLVLVAQNPKKGAENEWRVWAESAFSVVLPEEKRETSAENLDPARLLSDPAKIAALDVPPIDPIAIYVADDFTQGTLVSWYALLRDLGYGPKVLRKAEFLLHGYDGKALVLPNVSKLDEVELQGLRQFAKGGGVILADRGAPGLEQDFGFMRNPASKKSVPEHAILMQRASNKPLGLDSSELTCADNDLQLESPRVSGGPAVSPAHVMGRTLSGVPIVLVHANAGQRWIYLNLDCSAYAKIREQADDSFTYPGFSKDEYVQRSGVPQGGEVLRVLLGELLEEAAGMPVFQVKMASGAPARGVWRSVNEVDGARQIALQATQSLPHAENSKTVSVNLSHAFSWHWYDTAAGNYLKRAAEIPVELTPHKPFNLSALPYKLDAIKGRVRRLDTCGMFKLSFNLLQEPGAFEPIPFATHILDASLIGPAGYELTQYRKVMRVTNGSYEETYKLALNDPVGDYHLKMRDRLTGMKQEFLLTKYECWYGELFPVKMAP